jgi:diguanylate cyclase (GGDEF)-like protein
VLIIPGLFFGEARSGRSSVLAGAAIPAFDAQDRSDEDWLVERVLGQGFPLLSFPKALEQRFMKAAESRRRFMVLAAGWGSMILFAGMLIADLMMTPDVLPFAAIVRCVVFPAIVFAAMGPMRRKHTGRRHEWLVAWLGIAASVLEAIIILASKDGVSLARVVEFNIILVFICALARFWPALVAAASILTLHAYLATHLPDPTGVLVFNTSLLTLTTMVFLLYGNYKLEHDERLAFLLDAREQALNVALMQAHDRLMHMATTDTLTKVANRRYFETFLSESWERAVEQQRALSLIIIDIDFFKPYNDRYGHQAGDRCLSEVARALRRCTRRPNDLVARWGGEEFVVVMMDADVEAAAAAAERIREAVAELDMTHEASACAPRVTVSGGRATLRPSAGMESARLIELADEALYRAKASGRNRIQVGYEQPVLMSASVERVA